MGATVTWRSACELISEWLAATTGLSVTPEEIWEISPTGELWPVAALYDQAHAWRTAAY